MMQDNRSGGAFRLRSGELHDLPEAKQGGRCHAGIPRKIINRQLDVFAKADPAYAEGVKKALK